MRSYEKVLFALVALLVIGVATVTAELRNQNKPNQTHTIDQRPADDDSQFPIVDYGNPEPTDFEKRAKRKAKGRRYNKKYPDIGPGVIGQRSYHWPADFSPLPVAQSDIIVIGLIYDAEAFLSEDKNSVYSEFNLCLEHVLKDGISSALKPGSEIVLEREGGRVRYPSAKESRISFIGFGMPRVGRRYVFFLKRNQEEDFHILTGYELRQTRVFPLDSSPGVVHFEIYENANDETFLNELEAAIAKGTRG